MSVHPITEAFLKALIKLTPPKKPISIDEIKSTEEKIFNIYESYSSCLKAKSKSLSKNPLNLNHIGLNTVGMLIDRLSILSIKSYMRKEEISDIKILEDDEQIKDIEDALAYVKEGTSSSYNKISNLKESISADTFDLAVMRLGAVNLVLWLSQDVLYLRGPNELPDSELRKYITYFAEKNITRNKLISLSNYYYWN